MPCCPLGTSGCSVTAAVLWKVTGGEERLLVTLHSCPIQDLKAGICPWLSVSSGVTNVLVEGDTQLFHGNPKLRLSPLLTLSYEPIALY